MKERRVWPVALLVLGVGLIAGGLGGALFLIGPGGYRPPQATAIATPTPSASPRGSPTASATTGPSPRAWASMAFDQATGKIILYGGVQETQASFDTLASDSWTWDGRGWAQVSAGGPSPRYASGMAYDPVHRVVVLRGGFNELSAHPGFIDDTWTWDGSRWLLMSPAQSAPAFIGGAEPLIWDAALKSTVLFAYTRQEYLSYDIPALNETWSWDGSTWTNVSTSTPPSGHERSPAAIAYDSARNAAVFFGRVSGTPTTWVRSGMTWSVVSTAGTASASFNMAYDEARSVVLLFGSNRDTWTWDGTRWTAQTPAHQPPARAGSSMAYDSVRHVIVLFGGTGLNRSGVMFGDTWTWDGKDWTQLA